MANVYFRKENVGYIYFIPELRKYLYYDNEENAQKEIRTLLNNDIRYIEKKSSNSQHKLDGFCAPLAAYIEISDKCNLSCSHCFKSLMPYSKTMTSEDILNIIDQLYELGVFELRFVGFEPTTNPELLNYAEYARNKGFYIVLNTNGYLPDKYQQRIVDFDFDEILISIDVIKTIMTIFAETVHMKDALVFSKKCPRRNNGIK